MSVAIHFNSLSHLGVHMFLLYICVCFYFANKFHLYKKKGAF